MIQDLGVGLRTDLMIARNDVLIEARDEGLVVRTPSNPDFFWGNYIILPKAPGPGDGARLEELFRAAFSEQPAITHFSFTWPPSGMEDPILPAAAESWKNAGYDYDVSVLLSTQVVRPPPHLNRSVEIREIVEEENWSAVYRLQLLCSSNDYDRSGLRRLLDRRMASWRALTASDRGAWFGAFLGGTLIGDAGIFWDDELARFQNVETHPGHRRQGVCGTLVAHVGRAISERLKKIAFVLEADEDDHAARIYESLGFRGCERVGSFCKYDRKKWGPKGLNTEE